MSIATAQPLSKPVPPSRMTLKGVVKGKVAHARKVTLYGPAGIGKTTFGALAPNPIFLPAEKGTDQLDVARFPRPETWRDALEAVQTLTTDEHDYKTFVVDTLDAIEPLLWTHMCKRDSTAKSPLTGIEDYGYGKGYQNALTDWRVFLAGLERLIEAKGMNVILIAHSQIKNFKNPEGEDFDRYIMKLNEKASGLISEWSDALLFANYETYAHKDERTKRVRGFSTGARVIHTQRTAAFEAKNRYSLPETLPLAYADFDAAATAGQVAAPADLRAEILEKAKQLAPDIEKAVTEAVKKAGDNSQSLALINNRVNARLAEVVTVQNTATSAAQGS